MQTNMKEKLEVNFTEITCKVEELEESSHENLLANAMVTFSSPGGYYFTISGFTVWKSKYGGIGRDAYNVEVPKKKTFKYLLMDKAFKKLLSELVVNQFVNETIPTIK